MRGNPEIAVRKLAIPIMISMLLTASYNIIDGIWIAGLGQAAIAGIGFVTPIFMILNGVSVGRTRPLMRPLMRRASSMNSRCRAMMRPARSSSCAPLAVRLMPRGVRSNRAMPSSSSMALMWALMAGWLRNSRSEARVMLPSRATAKRVRS